jgi:ribosomal protein S27E
MKKEFQGKCIECGSENVVYDEELNEVSCNDCGAIFEELTPKEEKEEEEVSKGRVPKKH